MVGPQAIRGHKKWLLYSTNTISFMKGLSCCQQSVDACADANQSPSQPYTPVPLS